MLEMLVRKRNPAPIPLSYPDGVWGAIKAHIIPMMDDLDAERVVSDYKVDLGDMHITVLTRPELAADARDRLCAVCEQHIPRGIRVYVGLIGGLEDQ